MSEPNYVAVEFKVAVPVATCAVCKLSKPRIVLGAESPRLTGGWTPQAMPEGCTLIARSYQPPEGWQSVYIAGDDLLACPDCAGKLLLTVRETIARLGRGAR